MDGWGVGGAGGLIVLRAVDASYIGISPSSPSSISSEPQMRICPYLEHYEASRLICMNVTIAH